MTKDEALRLAIESLCCVRDMVGHPDNLEYIDHQVSKIEAALEAKDEPWEEFCDSHCVWTDHHPDCKLAQRTWVGLTDEEMLGISEKAENALRDYVRPETALAICKNIEAKIKEKNT